MVLFRLLLRLHYRPFYCFVIEPSSERTYMGVVSFRTDFEQSRWGVMITWFSKMASKTVLYCLWQQQSQEDSRSIKWISRRLKENQGKTKYGAFVAAFTRFVKHKTTSKCLDENKVTTIQKCTCDCVIIILYMYLGVLNGKNT